MFVILYIETQEHVYTRIILIIFNKKIIIFFCFLCAYIIFVILLVRNILERERERQKKKARKEKELGAISAIFH